MGRKSAKFLSGKTERPVTEQGERGWGDQDEKKKKSKKFTLCCECGFLWAFCSAGLTNVVQSVTNKTALSSCKGFLFFFCNITVDIQKHHFLVLHFVSTTLVSYLTLRRLMSYIYGAPILDVSSSHTTTQNSR